MAFEINIIKWLQKFSSPVLDTISIIGSHFFSYAMVIILAVALFLFYNKKFAISFSLVMIVGVLLNLGLKYLIARDRPFLADNFIVNIYESSGFAYPSGHSVAAMGVALTLGFVFRSDFGTRRGHIILATLIVYLVLNMLNRMYLGQHFLTDVIAGYALMFGICWAALLIFPGIKNTTYRPIVKINKKNNQTLTN